MIDIYYGLFEIDLEFLLIYILLISYFKIVHACSCRLSIALYHIGHVVGCNSKREFSSKMVGSCLLITNLSDRNISLGNVHCHQGEQSSFYDYVLLLLLTLHTLLNAIVRCTRVHDFVVALNLISKCAC